jgi:hypothetical protein
MRRCDPDFRIDTGQVPQEHYFLAKQPQKQYSLLYLSSMV